MSSSANAGATANATTAPQPLLVTNIAARSDASAVAAAQAPIAAPTSTPPAAANPPAVIVPIAGERGAWNPVVGQAPNLSGLWSVIALLLPAALHRLQPAQQKMLVAVLCLAALLWAHRNGMLDGGGAFDGFDASNAPNA